jgi:hypothetical protein
VTRFPILPETATRFNNLRRLADFMRWHLPESEVAHAN